MPSFDCMQIRVADSQSRTPGWVSVNGFAHLQLREGARACRVLLGQYPRNGRRVVGSAAKRAHSAVETAIPGALVVDFRALQAASRECRARDSNGAEEG